MITPLRQLVAAQLTKKQVRDWLVDPVVGGHLRDFCENLAGYQSNSGAYYKTSLRDAYHLLPDSLKNYLKPSPATLKRLYRGDDGESREAAISWSDAAGVARIFGRYVYTLDELESYSGALVTSKFLSLIKNIRELEDYGIGDDEGEVIIFDPVWKPDTVKHPDREPGFIKDVPPEHMTSPVRKTKLDKILEGIKNPK